MKKIKLLFVLSVILIFSSIFLDSFKNNLISYNVKLQLSKTSDRIYIVGNQGWIDFRNAGNCTGQGTSSDPYIIKDLTIDAENSGSCILIGNSSVYFRIENCICKNTGSISTDAAIKLEDLIMNSNILA